MQNSYINISDDFLTSLFEIDRSHLTSINVNKVKECLLDFIAAFLAGKPIVSDRLLNYLNNELIEFNENRELLYYHKLNIENQVYVTGFTSHAAELDDGSRFGMVHPGAPLFSLLLPIARQKALPFDLLAKATLVGYEASIRLAMAIAPGHYASGYHPTATCGTIGAALGLGSLLNLNIREMKNVLSIAAISASGSLKVIEDDSQIKPLNVANASLNGLYAVRAGVSGFNGANDALSGMTGFLNMMTDKWSYEKLIRDSQDDLMIHSVYFKPYAACRHAHAPIEAVLNLRNRLDENVDLIRGINVYVYETIIGKHDSKSINGSTSAKMSIPYAIAVAITSGCAGIECFEEPWLSDLKTRNFLDIVNVVPDEIFSSLVPSKRCARVEFVLEDGSTIGETVEYAKGEPESPMVMDDLYIKLENNLTSDTKVNAEEIRVAIETIDISPTLFYKILEKIEL